MIKLYVVCLKFRKEPKKFTDSGRPIIGVPKIQKEVTHGKLAKLLNPS